MIEPCVFGYLTRVAGRSRSILSTGITCFLLVLVLPVVAPAQNGGKAEPKRIDFEKGRSKTQLSGSLSNAQEMEYVFRALKGQTATVSNPNPALFDVRIFSEEADVETEFDSSRSFALDLPADGDYLLYVRKKIVQRPRRARFAITLSIR